MNQIDRLLTIMQRLRDPENGCPWDKEQTFATIAPYTLEETYEVLDAIAREDFDDLRGELGDLPPPRFDDGRRGEFLRQRRHFPMKLAVVSCRQGMVWLNMNFLHVIQLFCKTGDSLQMVRPGVDSRN